MGKKRFVPAEVKASIAFFYTMINMIVGLFKHYGACYLIAKRRGDKMSTGKVDVIIPVFNGSQYLKECLDSIESQTYREIHLIIVDDYSDDDSIEIIHQYQQRSACQVTLLKNDKNMGVSYSRNRALKYLEGQYVTFIDADDVLKPHHLATLVNCLKSSPARMAVTGGGSHLIINPKNIKRTKTYAFSDGLCEILGARGVEGYLWNKMFYAEDLQRSGIEFDNDIFMGEDLLFVCENFLFLRAPLIYHPPVTYYYRPNQASAMRKQLDKKGVIAKGDNWLVTYRKIFKLLQPQRAKLDQKVIDLATTQYLASINDLISNLVEVGELQRARQFQSEYFKFRKHLVARVMLSPYFSIKRKVSIAQKVRRNYLLFKKNRIFGEVNG